MNPGAVCNWLDPKVLGCGDEAMRRGTRLRVAGMCTTGWGVSQVAMTTPSVPSPAVPCSGPSLRCSSAR
eukprot:1030801-Prorocentrum_lima.AAC.1